MCFKRGGGGDSHEYPTGEIRCRTSGIEGVALQSYDGRVKAKGYKMIRVIR